MKALVFQGTGRIAWNDLPDPVVEDPADAIVRVDAVTICGTDLHILKGDLPEVTSGRVLGKSATLHREDLWIKDVTITTGLVDTSSTPMLLRMMAAGRLPSSSLITHRFELGEMEEAHDVFGRAAETGAVKVALGGPQHTAVSLPDTSAA
ncbi:hypothetical protein [Streptomyces sp. NPDC015130]|uniref:hypothetical protein n=1 Tax=Streptomyces sp. NPDC015130 TaxID=3364940 RepID=UPI0037001A26